MNLLVDAIDRTEADWRTQVLDRRPDVLKRVQVAIIGPGQRSPFHGGYAPAVPALSSYVPSCELRRVWFMEGYESRQPK